MRLQVLRLAGIELVVLVEVLVDAVAHLCKAGVKPPYTETPSPGGCSYVNPPASGRSSAALAGQAGLPG